MSVSVGYIEELELYHGHFTEKAIEAVEIALKSLDPKTAPRYSKETIEAERARVKEGLEVAITIIQQLRDCDYCEAGVAELHQHQRGGE